MLTSLEIKNFRAFSHLVIERLGRVNLIVGKNNVGKTTLLEALQICGSTLLPTTIRSHLDSRNEVRASAHLASSGEYKRHFDLSTLWHGRKVLADKEIEIKASSNSGNVCGFSLAHVTEDLKEWGLAIHVPNPPNYQYCHLYRDGSTRFRASLSEAWLDLPVDAPCLPGTMNDALEDVVGYWWDAVWATEGKNRVLQLMQAIVAIEDVIHVKDPRHPTRRMPRARIAGMPEPVPLASIGDGAIRFFHIGLALEFARYRADRIHGMPEEPGMSFSARSPDLYSFLLIDEVDTGIHHTMHHDLWQFIFQAARSLDVQVFATTHSLDCLRGFAEAAEDEQADAQVIRLEKLEGHKATRAVTFGQTDLPVVLRDSIEVR